MDEVDNIIIHSLRQIGCNIEPDILSLSSFTPELLVETVSMCLHLIKPSMNVPKKLPPGMAQRFTVTASLAEACTSIGFRGDIGYQTFLYSNVTEVRRVFMFLIERLPKESEKMVLAQPLDKLTLLENELQQNIRIQLSSPWIPQYCMKSGIRKYNSSYPILSGECTPFQPCINLNIPNSLRKSNIPDKQQDYWHKRSPSVFQQTNSQTILSSIIHKNDVASNSSDFNLDPEELMKSIITKNLGAKRPSSAVDSSKKLNEINHVDTSSSSSSSSIADKTKSIQQQSSSGQLDGNTQEVLNSEIGKLKSAMDELLTSRKKILADITSIKEARTKQEEANKELRNERKIRERTCILLENPEENVKKMDMVLAATKERMNKLMEQWKSHKDPLVKTLEKSKSKNSSSFEKNRVIQNEIKVVRDKISEIVDDLKHKNNLHAQLTTELQKVDNKISRNAYTTRILEIVGNIRKQKNDIDKVLRDTRELQKEINNINGQLDRQFTVTDDLLYKTARRDEHSKKIYKLLATLHSDCSDLVTLVQETGAVLREMRDVEDQIENEKSRNIAKNLEKITSDLKEMEKDSKNLQDKIRQIENEITQG
ncbi:unnamed protein product [Hermetia illucens]|uniref:Coiled-coil domain-containing protein 22 homolog n=1 Tax=Hermetia illucens TaxID=343691 RepID=A0A7R8YWB2_HERIL|nr:coiled-coil domain-containing protein 22 homolog [Hermetia illucens]CAD7087154.1 unnamed protein product [Hermetia illucens]